MEMTEEALAAPPCHFLILNNVQKMKNVKNMLVSASAFGVKEVFVVGQKTFDLQEQKPFLSSLSCHVTRVATLKDCRARCQERGIRIVGVEIMHDAKSIADSPFCGDTAFIMGNEVRLQALIGHVESLLGRICCIRYQGSGMNAAQVAICDDFVYIPQYGGGTASLNVTVAASIILHTFALWAKLPIVNTEYDMEENT